MRIKECSRYKAATAVHGRVFGGRLNSNNVSSGGCSSIATVRSTTSYSNNDDEIYQVTAERVNDFPLYETTRMFETHALMLIGTCALMHRRNIRSEAAEDEKVRCGIGTPLHC